jgi:zinc D-Ala-D-Ala carboxypeptidase
MTSTRDAQRILAGIGFPIVVDGSPGPNTTQAVTWFQEAWTRDSLDIDGVWGPATDAAARACLADHGATSDHYRLVEFACRHCRWPRAHRSLVRGLEVLRARFYPQAGLPILSGYRCPVHNAAIHGATNSQHLFGRAADISPHGDGGNLVTVEEVASLERFGGLEYQPKLGTGRGCTHVDTRAGGNPKSPSVFAWG